MNVDGWVREKWRLLFTIRGQWRLLLWAILVTANILLGVVWAEWAGQSRGVCLRSLKQTLTGEREPDYYIPEYQR